jgi:hypothetical protein
MLCPFYVASSAGGHSQGQREDAGGASLAQEHGGNGHRPAGIDLIVDEQDRTGAGVGLDGGGEVIRHGQGAPVSAGAGRRCGGGSPDRTR